ncbi:MAG: Gfo/Idh/MocA family oxidoreductase [Paenisporosarcina sp.]
MKKTTFALIGTGIVGERIINQILGHSTCEIVAIYDENTTRLQEMKTKYNLHSLTSLQEIWALKPDWVYIGTPPNQHADLTELAAKQGCHVLSEKPLAHDVSAGERMVEVTKEMNVHSAMHFPLMYSDAVQSLMAAVKDGSLGSIERIELQTYFPHWPRLWQQNPWIASREQGGFIREVFPHYFQIMYRLFNHFSIQAFQTNYPENIELCETSTIAFGQTDKGIPILINGQSGIAKEEELTFTIYGSKKVLTLKNWSVLLESEFNQKTREIKPSVKAPTLFEECHAITQKQDAYLVSFEEGLIVQKWIDQFLS